MKYSNNNKSAPKLNIIPNVPGSRASGSGKVVSIKLPEATFNENFLKNQTLSPIDSDTRGLTFYKSNINQFTSSPESNSAIEMSCYLKEKVALLEKENQMLKNELTLKMTEKEKFEYFLRLRKELIEEVQSLRGENNRKEIKYEVEIAKLEEQIKVMKNRENTIEREIMEKFQKQFASSPTKSLRSVRMGGKTPKISPGKPSPHRSLFKDGEITNRSGKFNIELVNSASGTGNKKVNFGDDEYYDNNIGSDLKLGDNEMDENNENLEDSNFIDTISRQSSHLENPYTRLMMELKNQIKYLEHSNVEKEERYSALKLDFDNANYKKQQEVDLLQKSLKNWQYEYNKQLVKNKTIYDEFVEMSDIKEKSIKDTQTNFNNDLTKKIMHLEKVNSNLTREMEKINELNLNYSKDRDEKIARLEEKLAKLLLKYEDLWKSYEIDLNSLTDIVRN